MLIQQSGRIGRAHLETKSTWLFLLPSARTRWSGLVGSIESAWNVERLYCPKFEFAKSVERRTRWNPGHIWVARITPDAEIVHVGTGPNFSDLACRELGKFGAVQNVI